MAATNDMKLHREGQAYRGQTKMHAEAKIMAI